MKILHNEKFPHDTFDATNLRHRYKQNTWLSTIKGSVFVDTTFTRSYPVLAHIAPYFKAHRGTVCLIFHASSYSWWPPVPRGSLQQSPMTVFLKKVDLLNQVIH